MGYVNSLLSEFIILWKGIQPNYMKLVFPLYAVIMFLIAKTIKRNDKTFLKRNLWKRFNYIISLDGFKFVSEKSLVSIHLTRNYETKTLNFMKNIKGKIFIDVGAHVGRYSILLSKNFKKIIAIEPDPYNFSYLVKNIYMNNLQSKILPLCIALSDKIDFLKLYLDEPGSGSHSLVKVYDKYTYTVSVPLDYIIEKMDDIRIEDISLIKIDVEGVEYNVLRGMKNILTKGNPILIIEIWEDAPNKEDTIKLLKDMGYEVRYKFAEDVGVTNYVFISKR